MMHPPGSPPCDPDTGQCVTQPGGVVCQCAPGYFGPTCASELHLIIVTIIFEISISDSL